MGWADALSNLASGVVNTFANVNWGNVGAPLGFSPTTGVAPPGTAGYSPMGPIAPPTSTEQQLQQIMGGTPDPNMSLMPPAAAAAAPPPANVGGLPAAPVTPGTPSAPTDYGNWLGKILGYGTAGGKALLGGAISHPADIANLLQAYQRYNLSQNLLDPNYVGGQAEAMRRKVNMATKARIAREVGGSQALQGMGGAPGMYSQAVAEAIAPYEFQSQQEAMRNYLNTVQASEQAYPMGGPEAEFSNFLEQLMLQQKQQQAYGSQG